MATNLVIVESPAKAGTINKYLGKDYKVVASMGHIRDLPSSKLGVDVDEAFEPKYVIPTKARKTVTALKKELKGKKRVYLATDLDREGEAIAWHIAQALDLANLDIEVQRITFDEITESAIKRAIAAPREIDQDLVDAQQARRVLDRLVGYTLSPVLWRKVAKGLSAGRVQSAALRLLVDREREREAFKPDEYWQLEAELLMGSGGFTASLQRWDGAKLEQLELSGPLSAEAELEARANPFIVQKVDAKKQLRRPQAPYTTSTYQQDAVNQLGLTAKSAMRLAQKLYEAGKITYMRTDSVDMAAEAVASARAYVTGTYGAPYVPGKPNVYAGRKQAQEAHECIRPTDFGLEAGSITDPQEAKAYDLIRRRALSSQMSPAEVEGTSVDVTAGKAGFRATGQRILFPGFYAVRDPDKADNALPALAAGDVLTLAGLRAEQHFTEPAPRYNEASLVKSLEEAGIGRPSTYAATISTLTDRGYARSESRRLVPEPIGLTVTDLLIKHFPDIVDLEFTAKMEDDLDGVAGGSESYAGLLGAFWGPFHASVEENEEKIEKVNLDVQTEIPCPTCGKLMLKKRGRFGEFLACPDYPECKTTMSLEAAVPSGLICPLNGMELKTRRSRRGIFYGCTGYPECKFAVNSAVQIGKKVLELEAAGTEVPFKKEALEAARIRSEADEAAKTAAGAVAGAVAGALAE